MLVRVVAPHFVAGFEIESDRCYRAAPILRWFVGLTSDQIRQHCKKRGWKALIVREQ
jgi:hypothetical protein